MFEPAYRYRASLVRVIDGDTYVLSVDVGFHTAVTVHVRVRNYNAPEIHGREAPAGLVARMAAKQCLEAAHEIGIETYHDEQSFERWIADVYVDGRSIVDLLDRKTGTGA